jgi:inosine-uridine nucleoside N-ribohydrolase
MAGFDWPLVKPRARVIIDNDFAGDRDDMIQTAHHLMSPSVDVRFLIASHLPAGDIWDPSTSQAANAERLLNELLDVMGLKTRCTVHRGAELALQDPAVAHDTAAARAIIAEARRDDTRLRLYFAAGAGLTDLASALLIDPTIAHKMTLVWIGGPEYPELATEPPRRDDTVEYNLSIDVKAAQVVFDSDIAIWQVPRDAYRQLIMSYAELLNSVAPHGRLGRYLRDAIEGVMKAARSFGYDLGETYVMGDSPLVTLTALQSSFQPDPSSSRYRVLPRPSIRDDGRYGPNLLKRPPIRVYTAIDARLTFSDFFAKLALWAQQES